MMLIREKNNEKIIQHLTDSIDLCNYLWKFYQCMHYLDTSMSYNTFEGLTILHILNGGNEAQETYCSLFEYSFDEEVYSFEVFIKSYINKIDNNFNFTHKEQFMLSEIEMAICGLEFSKTYLNKISQIIKNNALLENTLLRHICIDENGFKDENYKPFKNNIQQFIITFVDFAEKFIKELKEKISDECYSEKYKKIENINLDNHILIIS